MPHHSRLPVGIDITRPSPARTYNYVLGGHDHYQADREAADSVIAEWPGIVAVNKAQRAWMIRAISYLAEQGIDQFLDLGSGLPAAENVHQVAQRINPGARVVYVDHDPTVLAHGLYLLAGSPLTSYLQADVRDTKTILDGAAELLDLSEPVAVVCSAVLHYVDCDPAELMDVYTAAAGPGSYLALSHAADDGDPLLLQRVIDLWARGGGGFYPRSRDEIARIFERRDLVPPGLELIERWRSSEANPPPLDLPLYGAIARL